MYKKITHNIVEEHFDHPIAAELKKKVDKAIAPRATLKPRLNSTVTPEASLYMAAHELVAKLTWGVRNYLVSALNGGEDSQYIKDRLLKDIAEFGPVLTTYYSPQVGDDVVTHLTEFAKVFCDLVATAKAEKDTTKGITDALGHLEKLSKVLGAINPKFWPEDVVNEYLHQYAIHVIAQITARIKKEWEADTLASLRAVNIMMNGPVSEGTLKGMPDFSNVFASGIIKQFPNLFPNED